MLHKAPRTFTGQGDESGHLQETRRAQEVVQHSSRRTRQEAMGQQGRRQAGECGATADPWVSEEYDRIQMSGKNTSSGPKGRRDGESLQAGNGFSTWPITVT